MTTDITRMGPHALASYNSRLMALRAFGVSDTSLTQLDDPHMTRALAQSSRTRRELVIQGEHHLTVVE